MSRKDEVLRDPPPSHEDLGARKPRRRRNPNRPPMPENYKATVEEARERHKTRTVQPGIRIQREGEHQYSLRSPFKEQEPWEVAIHDAFGTRSTMACQKFMEQLVGLCQQQWEAGDNGEGGQWIPDEWELNQILAIIAGTKPENEVQACLVAQMVVVHLATMRAGSRMLRNGIIIDEWARTVSRLTDTYGRQYERLLRSQGKIQPQRLTVTYEKHVHVHHHTHIPPAPPAEEFGGPRHAPNLRVLRAADTVPVIEHAPSPAMPGQDAEWEALPGAEGEGPSPLQDARLRAKCGGSVG